MFINLTQHTITLVNEQREIVAQIPPSGDIARCTVESLKVSEIEGIPLFTSKYGEVYGLPDYQEGTILIVSMLVRAASPERKDLASPGELLRDDKGVPIGAVGLNIN